MPNASRIQCESVKPGRDERQQRARRPAARRRTPRERGRAACRSATRCRPRAARGARARSRNRVAERRVDVGADVVRILAGQRAAVADHVGVGRDHVRRLVAAHAGRGDRHPRHRRQHLARATGAARRALDRSRVVARRAPSAPAPAATPGQLRLGLVGEQALDRAREVAERVVGAVGIEAWPARAEDAQAQRGDLLLADRDRHHAAAVGELEQRLRRPR